MSAARVNQLVSYLGHLREVEITANRFILCAEAGGVMSQHRCAHMALQNLRSRNAKELLTTYSRNRKINIRMLQGRPVITCNE